MNGSLSLLFPAMLIYVGILLAIGYFTGKNMKGNAYYLGNRQAPWYLIGMGMIADSLSGVTFISIPGDVGKNGFLYLQIVAGYVLGYILISRWLIPMYYRLQLTSIYGYLEQRYGDETRKTGAFLFILSRLLGAGARLYLAVLIIQTFFLDAYGVPMALTVALMILLMVAYTARGGIKTLIITDAFQAGAMLLALVICIFVLFFRESVSLSEALQAVPDISSKDWLDLNPKSDKFFLKQFAGGALIALCMTGLDQSMMQKSLSCKNVGDAQKNLEWFGIIVFGVNLLFLSFGAMLYSYAAANGIDIPQGKTDLMFPHLAINVLGMAVSMAFVLGLLAATFSSADSVLTTLTTSVCFDFLNFEKKEDGGNGLIKQRRIVHLLMSSLLLLTILAFHWLNEDAIINTILKLATYTYGPLLGLFLFGLQSKRLILNKKFIPVIALASPFLSFAIELFLKHMFSYQAGLELLGINAGLTVFGLWMVSVKPR
jgi:Na+/proline symporter